MVFEGNQSSLFFKHKAENEKTPLYEIDKLTYIKRNVIFLTFLKLQMYPFLVLMKIPLIVNISCQ